MTETQQIVEQIAVLQKYRVAAIDMQRRIDNQAAALARRVLGWSLSQDDGQREDARKQAEALLKRLNKEGLPDEPSTLERYVFTAIASREPYDHQRKEKEKLMRSLARQLPVWPWVESVKGMGDLGLAIIVAEAGDLANYASPAKLWKRLGLAPKFSYAMTKKDGTTGHAVPRRTRSAIWTIGDSLLKAQGKESGLPYREAYEQRKAYEADRNPEMSKMHAHRRAQRVMEKRLLKDLWRAWRLYSVIADTNAKYGEALQRLAT